MRSTVIITIEDANDNDPQFVMDKYEFSVLEEQAANTWVGRVQVSWEILRLNNNKKQNKKTKTKT